MATTLIAFPEDALTLRYRQPYLSPSLNAKFKNMVSPGVYQGLTLETNTVNNTVKVTAGAASVTSIDNSAYQVSIQLATDLVLDLSTLLSQTVTIGIEASYTFPAVTTASIRAWGATETVPASVCIIGKVTVPSITGLIPASNLSYSSRTLPWDTRGRDATPFIDVLQNGNFVRNAVGASPLPIPFWRTTGAGSWTVIGDSSPSGYGRRVTYSAVAGANTASLEQDVGVLISPSRARVRVRIAYFPSAIPTGANKPQVVLTFTNPTTGSAFQNKYVVLSSTITNTYAFYDETFDLDSIAGAHDGLILSKVGVSLSNVTYATTTAFHIADFQVQVEASSTAINILSDRVGEVQVTSLGFVDRTNLNPAIGRSVLELTLVSDISKLNLISTDPSAVRQPSLRVVDRVYTKYVTPATIGGVSELNIATETEFGGSSATLNIGTLATSPAPLTTNIKSNVLAVDVTADISIESATLGVECPDLTLDTADFELKIGGASYIKATTPDLWVRFDVPIRTASVLPQVAADNLTVGAFNANISNTSIEGNTVNVGVTDATAVVVGRSTAALSTTSTTIRGDTINIGTDTNSNEINAGWFSSPNSSVLRVHGQLSLPNVPLSLNSGGTGANLSAGNPNKAVVFNAAGTALEGVAPDTAGNVLTSNGTAWVSAPPSPLDCRVYTSGTPTLAILAAARFVEIACIGGGGGGGGGARGDGLFGSSGGVGGAGGGFTRIMYEASYLRNLGTTLSITVGAGGSGGTGAVAGGGSPSSGVAGTGGANSFVTLGSTQLALAAGGQGGDGGVRYSAALPPASLGGGGIETGGIGGAATAWATPTAAVDGQLTIRGGGGGGGSGGNRDASGTPAYGAGVGGRVAAYTRPLAGGLAGSKGAAGGAGSNDVVTALNGGPWLYLGGSGGGGGGSNDTDSGGTGIGGNGGVGGQGGGGGGGGGAGYPDAGSGGNGGNGGSGKVIIRQW